VERRPAGGELLLGAGDAREHPLPSDASSVAVRAARPSTRRRGRSVSSRSRGDSDSNRLSQGRGRAPRGAFYTRRRRVSPRWAGLTRARRTRGRGRRLPLLASDLELGQMALMVC
jgi:hypothetical protein